MRFGVVLPTLGRGVGGPGLDAAAEAARRHGWSSLWVTDHLLVPPGEEADEYGSILEALTSLAWIAARHDGLRLGTSVIVPAMRDAPLLAKELATIDVLSGGRLIVGVGVGDREDLPEWTNLGKEARMGTRGAYLDEAIALWRHLWAGRREPFRGRFHTLESHVFAPLPPQGASLPIWSGGRSERALQRAGTLADGYHASQTGPNDLRARLPAIESAAQAAGRRRPTLSIRARVRFGAGRGPVYALAGTPREMATDLAAFAALGVDELIVVLGETEPAAVTAAADRFQSEVVERWRQDERERAEAVREEYSM